MDQRVVLERGELETPFKAWRLALGACVAALSLAACRGAPPGTSVRADVGPDYSVAPINRSTFPTTDPSCQAARVLCYGLYPSFLA